MLVYELPVTSNAWLSAVAANLEHSPIVNYWCNFNLDKVKKENVQKIVIYSGTTVMLVGTLMDYFENTPVNTYDAFKNNLGGLGLFKGTDSYIDFENLLSSVFDTVPANFGNIIFKVELLSNTFKNANYKNFNLKNYNSADF